MCLCELTLHPLLKCIDLIVIATIAHTYRVLIFNLPSFSAVHVSSACLFIELMMLPLGVYFPSTANQFHSSSAHRKACQTYFFLSLCSHGCYDSVLHKAKVVSFTQGSLLAVQESIVGANLAAMAVKCSQQTN